MNKLNESGLKYNTEKCFFGKTKIEYLGFLVTHDGIKHINEKLEAITNMTPPTYSKGNSKVYRFSSLSQLYVGKILTYVSAFN